VIHTVKQQLTASGFGLAAKIPETGATFVLFGSPAITKVQSGFNLLNTLGIWLPIIALVLIALGVYIAKRHRRALIGASLGVAAGMIVLALGLAIFRSVYLNALPPLCRMTPRRSCTTRWCGTCAWGCVRCWS
jgi:hypothetical protein